MDTSDMLAVLAVLLITVALFAPLATMPRWLFRSLVVHQLWSLRDAMVLDVVRGELPNTPAVNWHIERVARIIAVSGELTFFRLIGFTLATLPLSSRARRQMDAEGLPPTGSTLLPTHRHRLQEYDDKLSSLAATLALVGTWLGILVGLLMPLIALIAAFASRPDTTSRERVARHTEEYATFRADQNGLPPLVAA